MASPIGSVYISLGADTAEFDRGMKSAQATVKAFGRDTASASTAAERNIKGMAAAVRELTAAEGRMGGGASMQRGQDVAAYGAELDRLRAKFNPVFAASKAYEASLDELSMAHRVGAISAQEYEAALEGLNRRYQGVAVGAQAAEGSMNRATSAVRQANANARNLSFQLIDIGQSIPLAFQSPLYALQNLGFQIAQIGQIYMGNGGMRQALTDMVGQLTVFARYVGPAAIGVGALSAAFAGMASEINETSDVTVTFGDTALASFQVIRDAIERTLMPVVEDIAPAFASVWDAVQRGAIATGNALVNAMRIAAEGIAAAIRAIPSAFATAWNQAKAIVLGTIADMAGAMDRFIYSAITGLNEAFGTAFKVPDTMAKAYGSINGMANDALEAGTSAAAETVAAWEGFQAKAAEIAASNPLGKFFDAVSGQAQTNARSRLAGGPGGGGGGSGGASNEATRQREAERREIEKLIQELEREEEARRELHADMMGYGQDFIAEQQMEAQAVGLTREAANRLRYEFDFLAEAQREGIELTAEQRARYSELAAGMAATEAETERLQDAFDLTRDTVGGFFHDFRRNLQNGEGLWKSFADAATRAIDRVTDRLMDQLLDAIFEVNSAASGGGGGGWLGKLLGIAVGAAGSYFSGGFTGGTGATGTGFFSGALSGGGGGSLSFQAANGAAFNRGNITPFARGGIVSSPTLFPMARGAGLMGEAGPEAVMPLTRRGGRLGVDASGMGMNITIVHEDRVGVKMRTEQRETPHGPEIRTIIDRATAANVAQGGSRTRQALGSIGQTKVR